MQALFRALNTKHATPKYGLIFHASRVGQAAPKIKGKISWSLTAKTALTIRCDALGDNQDNAMGLENTLKTYNPSSDLVMEKPNEPDKEMAIDGDEASGAKKRKYEEEAVEPNSENGERRRKKKKAEVENADEVQEVKKEKKKAEEAAEEDVDVKKEKKEKNEKEKVKEVEKESSKKEKKKKRKEAEEEKVEAVVESKKEKKEKKKKEKKKTTSERFTF